MGKIVLYMWMSLDGFIAGPEDGPGQELGIGGDRLHDFLTLDEGDPSSARSDDEVGATVWPTRWPPAPCSPAGAPSNSPGTGTATTTTASRSSC